ncbi:IS66 family transposase [Holophaga foetida]|uniref:IS66 family transposase n=1 Tax=Holophaga foetida TaxID=35839 RepID=UPI0002471D12|nr:IS66 family transposase [Holophaga foetida]
MDELQRQVDELKALLAASLQRIQELESKLTQNSGNSSKPPSSDMGRKRKPPVDPSGRKRGGQPGHAGKTREQVPPEEVDEVKDADPESCERCGESLEQAPRRDAIIRQFCESPAFRAFITELRQWSKACPRCGHVTRAAAPVGTPKGAFGPRLQALTGMLSGRFRLTKREIMVMHRSVFGVRMSLGSVAACCKSVSEAVAPTARAIHEEVKASPVVHADETGFGRCGEDRMWLWVAATAEAEAFRLLPGRGQAQAKDILGEDYPGIIQRDRWKPYEKFLKAKHQLCHSHIRRDVQGMLESKGETGTQGCMLKLASDKAFHLWHQCEQEEISREELAKGTQSIQAEMRERFEILAKHPDTTKKARGTANDLLRQWDRLWTYLTHEGVVPTNNEAERAIRKAVLWRKVSLGVESEHGARFVERMLTLAGTARKRGVDLLEWLTQAMKASLVGIAAPDFTA